LQADLPAADWQQQLADLRAQGGTASDLMTTPVITIPLTAPLRQVVEQMTAHNLKRLPVVDGNGRLAGWISRVDILRTMEYHQPAVEAESEAPTTGTTIAELMYRDVPTVPAQATLEQIVQALEQNRRRRAVVIDADQRVLGIISDGDLLRRSQQEIRPGLLDRLRTLVTGQPALRSTALLAATETAVDLMTTPVFTIPVDASPAAALRLMMQHGVKRLPVVDGNGRLVGLLGRASLLRGLLDEA
jgi:CBS domain-containing protein